jgi:hypothetical protein
LPIPKIGVPESRIVGTMEWKENQTVSHGL